MHQPPLSSNVVRPSRDSQPLDSVVDRNIKALMQVRGQVDAQRTPNERIADVLTRFAGSMYFAYLHAVFFGGWLVINVGAIPGIRAFDPFPFVMLAMFASVEAIFLSTFVLVSQNRAARLSERRAELDLHINLLAEHELTEVVTMVEAIAKKLDVPIRTDRVAPLKKDVTPETVLERIEHLERVHSADPES
ncbi:MAG TPA: DUF1003 domain-containing protein [Polyangiaceae bacterium]|nr:DUF1003 domain-containing protein [Polyangiaceae bacterium]